MNAGSCSPVSGRVIEVPAAVTRLADGQESRLVWENEDALTFELGHDPDRRFVKWAPPSSAWT